MQSYRTPLLESIFDLLREAAIPEAISGKDFYDQLANPDFDYEEMFPIRLPVRLFHPEKKVNSSIELKVPVDLRYINRYIQNYIVANAELRKKYDIFAFWYNNFSNLIFGSLEESDACMFIAAVAFCSANTALDQNVAEASKIFSAVVSDFEKPEGKRILREIANSIKGNMSKDELDRLKAYADQGSDYAKLLLPKKSDVPDPTTGKDTFAEIRVSNAKIPNFNNFLNYYLDHDGKITKAGLMEDLKSGKFDISGTKIYSFFINLLDPDYKWKIGDDIEINPSTIDRWMIRVFFHDPLTEIVDEIEKAGVIGATDKDISSNPKDKPEDVEKKKQKHTEKQKAGIVNEVIMQMFSTDHIRQNLVKLLNKLAMEAGLTASQLQALAWVQIREEFGEKSAQFGSFEDVMAYTTETANKIQEIGEDIELIKKIGVPFKGKFNDAVRTIRMLSSTPRFKFTNPGNSVKSAIDRGQYEAVYKLPEKVAKLKGAKPNKSADYLETRIAMSDSFKKADIFVPSKSKTTPLKTIRGDNRIHTLKKSVAWILANV
jgi:hypothetical protein